MWRALPRAERVEILAYEHLSDQRRSRLLAAVREGGGSPWAWLAEILILAQAE